MHVSGCVCVWYKYDLSAITALIPDLKSRITRCRTGIKLWNCQLEIPKIGLYSYFTFLHYKSKECPLFEIQQQQKQNEQM